MKVRYLPEGLRRVGLMIYLAETDTIYVDPDKGVEPLVAVAMDLLERAGNELPEDEIRRLVVECLAAHAEGDGESASPEEAVRLVRATLGAWVGPDESQQP